MGDAGSLILFVGVILVIGAIPTVIALTRSRQQAKIWQMFADQHGLTFDQSGGDPRISGTYHGRKITIETLVTRSGTITTANTSVSAAVSRKNLPQTEILHVPVPISAKDRDKARSLPGYHDIVDTGDPAFDASYLVKTPDDAGVRKILAAGSAFQRAVGVLYQATDLLKVTTGDGSVGAEVNGRQIDLARLQKTLDRVCNAAEALDQT